jgi:serine/threonine protein kinase
LPTEQGNLKEPWIRLIERQESIADRYTDIRRIDDEAGDGSFSLVFTAQDDRSRRNKRVVLKFLDPSVAGDLYRAQCFHREADILKDLIGQKNILPLLQEKSTLTVQLDGIPFPLFYYCSYLARFNLTKYIYGEKKDALKNIQYFREVCKAVQRIHSLKICHRDLKPGNFLVFGSRYVCLSDFGTARYFDNGVEPIRATYRSPVGDVRYTAPELLCGLHFSDHHNFCADIYSLGAILFELFTKVELWSQIFKTKKEIWELIANFNVIPERNRLQVFDETIKGFDADRELYSIRAHDDSLPRSIANEVDVLYRDMARLDYRKRELNFNNIFMRINICEQVIRNYNLFEYRKRLKQEKRDM